MAKRRLKENSALKATNYAKATAQKLSAFLLIASAIALLIIGRLETRDVDLLRGFVLDLSSKVVYLIGWPVERVENGLESVLSIFIAYNENILLREENIELKKWELDAKKLKNENRILRELLSSVQSLDHPFITAEVYGTSGASFVRTLTINAGSRIGIKVGQAVVNSNGLIGRIVETGFNASRVLLVTDINSQIPVITEKTRNRAVLTGDNSNNLYLNFLSGHAEVYKGELLFTSGDGGLIPGGLLAGEVISKDGQYVLAKPVNKWDEISFVRVINWSKPVPSEVISESNHP